MISEECAETGRKLIYAREDLQKAVDIRARAKHPKDRGPAEAAQYMIKGAQQLYRETGISEDEARSLDTSVTQALNAINIPDYGASMNDIVQGMRKTLLDLMFQKVVACECAKK